MLDGTALVLVFVIVLGLLFGSFLNVVIHRLPLRESIVRPRSRCPACKTTIRPGDNIPVLSFLLLHGRCRSCDHRISARYPLVELLGAAVVTLAYVFSAGVGGFLVRSAFLLAMVAVAFIDFDHRLIPDRITLPAIPLGILVSPWAGISRLDALIGVLVGAGCLLLVGGAYKLLRGTEGIGGADIKLAGMMGAFLGWQGVLLAIFLGSFSGSVTAVILLRAGKVTRRGALPFGTFLAPGGAVALLFGDAILRWYLAL